MTPRQMAKTRKCPVCSASMQPVFRHLVLGRHEVDYFSCGNCGVLATEEPFWLGEAYQSAISTLDTWGASRSLYNQRRLAPTLSLLFGDQASFVDTACGYGLLVRLMRDIGFNFRGHDEYCQNVFSTPFAAPPGTTADAVTAFEVLEHLVNPGQFLQQQFERYGTDTIIASTTVFSGKPPPLDWPYYSFESGQHVTLYQPRSLSCLAQSVGATYHPLASGLHLITRRKFAPWKLRLLGHRKGSALHGALARWLRRGRSFIVSDYEAVRDGVLKNAGAGGGKPSTPQLSQPHKQV
jgi:hypothetical protein